MARTIINDKYGYVTDKGIEILKPEYDEVGSDGYNFYFGKKGTKYTCVDKEGKKIFLLDAFNGVEEAGEGYKKVSCDWCEEYIKFNSGIAVFKQDGRYRCTDKNEIPIISFYAE